MEYFLLHYLGDPQNKILNQNEETTLLLQKKNKGKKKNKQSGILSNKKNTKIEHTGSEELFL